jgi:hypothetical protein
VVVTGEGFGGSHEERAVGLARQLNVGREESYWAQGSVEYGLSVVKCTQWPELNG